MQLLTDAESTKLIADCGFAAGINFTGVDPGLRRQIEQLLITHRWSENQKAFELAAARYSKFTQKDQDEFVNSVTADCDRQSAHPR